MKKLILITSVVISLFATQGHSLKGIKMSPAMKLAIKGKYAEAAKLFKKECLGGNANSCGVYAFYLDPKSPSYGVKKDAKLALTFYEKACSLKDAQSCTIIGRKYYEKGNLKEAKIYLQKGCKLGDMVACKVKNSMH